MTRMWCLPAEYLCQQHLLGEHAECHQLAGSIAAGRIDNVRGHADKGQVDTARLQERHDALAEEIQRRGGTHDSPLEYDDELDLGDIDHATNLRTLVDRCEDCRVRVSEAHSEVIAG